MRTCCRRFTRFPLASSARAETSLGLAVGRSAFVEGGAVTGASAGSTAMALVVAGEISISDKEANSATADEAEYDDDGIVDAGPPDVGSTISKESAGECICASMDGFEASGVNGSEGKFDGCLVEAIAGTGRGSPVAFFQGVDVPHSSQ